MKNDWSTRIYGWSMDKEKGLKREITIEREFMWCGVYLRWVIECVMFSKVGNVFRSIGLVLVNSRKHFLYCIKDQKYKTKKTFKCFLRKCFLLKQFWSEKR